MRTKASLLSAASLVLVASGFSSGPKTGDRPTAGSYHAKTSLSGDAWFDSFNQLYGKDYGRIAYGTPGRYVRYYAWARFDLSSVPDDAEITGADFCMYQYASYGHQTVDRAVLVQDVMAPAQTLYNFVGNGTVVSEMDTCLDGWAAIPLNGLGYSAIESCLAQGYIDMGLQTQVLNFGRAYGSTDPSDLKAYLRVSFISSVEFCDMVALDGHLNTFPCRSSEAETVSFWVSCQGESSPGSVTAYLGLGTTAVDSQVMGEIHPGETLTTNLAFRAPPQEKKLQVACYTRVPDDSFQNNDTAYVDCWCFPAYTTAAVDFEPDHCPSFPPPGWAMSNSGGADWMLNSTMDPSAHTGRYYGVCAGGQYPPNNWLITSGLYVSPATADTVGLFLRSYSSDLDSVQVWALWAQDPSAQLGLLLDASLTSGWREFRLSLDQFESQPIYVGLHRFVEGGPGMCVDDVWFSCPMQSAVTESHTASPSADRFSLVPNLTHGPAVRLEYAMSKAAEVRVDILDVAGRCWLETAAKPARARGTVPLTVTGLPPGAYFVRAMSGAHTQILKFVLQR